MSGAQPPEVLADLFKQVLQQQAPAGAGSGNVAC